MTTIPKRPTIKDLYNTMLNDYQVRQGGILILLKNAVVKCIFWAVSGCLNMLWRFVSWIYLQIFPQTCGKEAIIRWGQVVGVDYKYGEKTVLKVKAEDVTADYILSGTVYKHLKSGNIYKSISSSMPIDGICEFTLMSTKSGSSYNLDKSEILEITNPLDGIPKTVEVLDVSVYGSEDEDIEVYRQKVLLRFRKKPQGGSFLDYVDWCKDVSGIVDALPYCLVAGVVTIFLVGEGHGKNRTPKGSIVPNPFPEWENGQMKPLSGSGLFLQVAKSVNGTDEFLNTRRPINVFVELRGADYLGFKIKVLGLKPVSNSLIDDIKNGFIEYLDEKRPHIEAIGYTEQNAIINANQLNAICQNVVEKNNGSYVSFEVTNSNNKKVDVATLGIGQLSYLEYLSINGVDIKLDDN